MKDKNMVGFDSWADLIAFVGETGESIYYKAPMDYKPVQVFVEPISDDASALRVHPPATGDVDPFDADEHHLRRFLRQAPEVTLCHCGEPAEHPCPCCEHRVCAKHLAKAAAALAVAIGLKKE